MILSCYQVSDLNSSTVEKSNSNTFTSGLIVKAHHKEVLKNYKVRTYFSFSFKGIKVMMKGIRQPIGKTAGNCRHVELFLHRY